MIKAVRQISFTVFVSVVLVIVISLCISFTVMSREKNAKVEETKYYRAKQQEYVQSIRGFLAEEGYRNSGVTMTEVVDEDGIRSFTVTIHHGKLEYLSASEKTELLAACKELPFSEGECEVSHKFLEEDL